MTKVKEMVRVNTRISADANNWLNNHSAETGLPKSTIIMLAIENYIREKNVLSQVDGMSEVFSQLQKLERQLLAKK